MTNLTKIPFFPFSLLSKMFIIEIISVLTTNALVTDLQQDPMSCYKGNSLYPEQASTKCHYYLLQKELNVPAAHSEFFISVCDSTAKLTPESHELVKIFSLLSVFFSCYRQTFLSHIPVVLSSLRMHNVFLSRFHRLHCLLQAKNGLNLLCEHGIDILVLSQSLVKYISSFSSANNLTASSDLTQTVLCAGCRDISCAATRFICWYP